MTTLAWKLVSPAGATRARRNAPPAQNRHESTVATRALARRATLPPPRLGSCYRSDVAPSLSPAEALPGKLERTPDYVRGQVLRAKYELLRPLDSGGMGVVWVARDRVLNVEVALKLIERAASERPEFTRRALSEARLAAAQQNIVPNF